jgi:hypothetical protein
VDAQTEIVESDGPQLYYVEDYMEEDRLGPCNDGLRPRAESYSPGDELA